MEIIKIIKDLNLILKMDLNLILKMEDLHLILKTEIKEVEDQEEEEILMINQWTRYY